MDQREQAGLHDSKDRHAFSKTVDRGTPSLLEKQQNGGDQRSCVADTDPPDEIDDREAPAYRYVDAPDSSALPDEAGNRPVQNAQDHYGQANDKEPQHRRVLGEHDA